MRKSAPALIFTTLIAFASGSAMALGDRAKDKKAHTDAATPSATTSQPSTSASTNGSAGSIDMDKKKKDGKCDPSKYTDKSTMPAECAEKTSPGGSSPSGAGGSSGSTGGAAGGAGSGSGTK